MPKRTTLGGVAIDETEPLSIINVPLDWLALSLAKSARALRFLQDTDGNLIGFPIIQMAVNPFNGRLEMHGADTDAATIYADSGIGYDWEHATTTFKQFSISANGTTEIGRAHV